MSRSPLVAVVHDRGSASPFEVVAAARGLCEVVFVCDGAPPGSADAVARVAELGRVLDVTGMSEARERAAFAALGADAVVTFSEYQLTRTARIAADAGLPYHSPRTVRLLVDKWRQREALRDAGVEATRCAVVRGVGDVAAALAVTGLPAVLKPRRGAGGVDTCRVDTRAEAEAMVAEFLRGHEDGDGFVLEELLVGDPDAGGEGFADYVSVESVTHAGETRHVCVTGKFPLAPPFRETGQFQPAALSDAAAREVEELAGAALAALGVERGVTHVEVKLTPRGPRIIEVNGRLGGSIGMLVRRAIGYDLVRAALLTALGRSPEVPRTSFPRVVFERQLIPPRDARRLVAVDGLAEVRAVEGVRHVDVAGPGTAVDWRAGTTGLVGVVDGTVADHDVLRKVVAEVGERLVLGYE